MFSYTVALAWSFISVPSSSTHFALATIVVFGPTSSFFVYSWYSPPFIEYSKLTRLSFIHVPISTVVISVLSILVLAGYTSTLYVFSPTISTAVPLTHFVHPSISLYPLPFAYTSTPFVTVISPV